MFDSPRKPVLDSSRATLVNAVTSPSGTSASGSSLWTRPCTPRRLHRQSLRRRVIGRAGTVGRTSAVVGVTALATVGSGLIAAPHVASATTSSSGSPNDVAAYGDAPTAGSAGNSLAPSVVGMAPTPTGKGYWTAASDGTVVAFGDAPSLGNAPRGLNKPIVGIGATPSGHGYYLVASDGGIFTFGDARYLGSTGNVHLNSPITGITTTPSGNGYWMVATDGGIFTFGDARYLGSTGGTHLNSPITGIAASKSGNGYWLVARDGGIFTFGDAQYHGSEGGKWLDSPIVSMTATRDGGGYWLVTAKGGVFPFGTAPYQGSLSTDPQTAPAVAIASTPTSQGYWLATGRSAPARQPLGTFVATCYSNQGTTASGAQAGPQTVAVDPSVIPLGTHLWIDGIGDRVAQDTGGDIRGNRIDIWNGSYDYCVNYGRQNVQVYVEQ